MSPLEDVFSGDGQHEIWTLQADDSDYPTRWALIKAGFSPRLGRGEHINASRRRNGERGIWQRRYWKHPIRDENNFARHVDYIHYNPVKHGHVMSPCDWPYSSFHRFVRESILPADWGENRVALEPLHYAEPT
jgi:putative transposase